MKSTSLWKQLAVCAVLIAGAASAWHYRAEVSALWTGSTAAQESGKERRARSKGTPVIVARAEMFQDDRRFSAIGTGFAARSITLRAPSSGEVISLDIAPGNRFAEGDVLMRLKDTDARLAVSLAEARFERATEERNRYRSLQDRGAAATARLEQAETDYKVAEIELERAREDLDNRVLRAPFDGITGLASIEIGDRVVTDEPIASLDDRSSILVEFDLPEALLGRVKVGLGIQATTPSVEDRSFDGMISAIDSRVNAATRTARVRASINNTGDLLRPGTSFALRLDLPGKTYPAVPELALQFSQDGLHVWRVTDGQAERVPLRLVRRRAGSVIVDGPIAEGDQIVVEGTQRLRGGASVQVLNPAPEPSS